MSDEIMTLELEAGIATLTLRRPKQLNALNRAVLTKLTELLEEVAANPEVRVLILCGEGKAFAAGADIKEMQSLSATEAEAFARLGQTAFSKLEQLRVPTIALVQGYALGGGMELAMACDIRLAAQGTKFGQPEVTLGVIPGFGGSQRLPRIIGQGRALNLLLTGELISADAALQIGLVTRVTEPDELYTEGRKLAEQLAGLAPMALARVKQAVYSGAEVDLPTGLAMEASLFGLSFATDDQTEGMTAFVEKRKATFQGK